MCCRHVTVIFGAVWWALTLPHSLHAQLSTSPLQAMWAKELNAPNSHTSSSYLPSWRDMA